MTFQDHLTGYLDTARLAGRQLDPLFDPRAHLARISWAMIEIRAKTSRFPSIDVALADVAQVQALIAARLNDPSVLLDRLETEKALLETRLDALAKALDGAEPDPMAAFLLGH